MLGRRLCLRPLFYRSYMKNKILCKILAFVMLTILFVQFALTIVVFAKDEVSIEYSNVWIDLKASSVYNAENQAQRYPSNPGVGTGVLDRPKRREGSAKNNAPKSGRFLLISFGDQITRTRRTASRAVRSASAVAGTAPVTSKMV